MKILTCALRSLACTLVLTTFAAIAQTPSTEPAAPPTTPPSTATPAQSAQPAGLPDAPSTIVHDVPPAVPTGPAVVIDTTMGRLTCKLYEKEAPLTVANFIGLAKGTKTWTDPVTMKKMTGVPFYDGTTFHRVIPGFMIQGGDRMGTGEGDAGYYIPDEISPSLRFDVPGRLAMANSGPGTDGSQFFITQNAVPQLDGNYTIFGQCDPHTVLMLTGIAMVDRDANDKPLTPITMNKVTIVPNGQPMPPLPSSPALPSTPAPKPM
jgi:peptidyl-prolyl cis-trans isomerase A (cyclophilin A)